MKALCCVEPGTLRLIDVAEPKAAKGEVLVRIRNVGICGTDYHIFHGNQPYLDYPRVIGHELGGEVVGSAPRQRARAGQRRPSSPICIAANAGPAAWARRIAAASCRCWACTARAARASIIAVPERHVVPADGLTSTRPPWSSSSPSARMACAAPGVGAGSRVAVVGAGPIGIAAAIFARRAART